MLGDIVAPPVPRIAILYRRMTFAVMIPLLPDIRSK
jgi:hypothetical protein